MQNTNILPVLIKIGLVLTMLVCFACASNTDVDKKQTDLSMVEEIYSDTDLEYIVELETEQQISDTATPEIALIGAWKFLHNIWYDSSSEVETMCDNPKSLVVNADLSFTFVDIGTATISEGYIQRDHAGHLIAVIEIDGSDDWVWGLRYNDSTGQLQIITNFDSSTGASRSLEWLHYYFLKQL